MGASAQGVRSVTARTYGGWYGGSAVDLIEGSAGQEGRLMAQDAVAAAPNVYTVVFENEHVRLLEARVRPGDSSVLHQHPDGLVYVVSGGKVTFGSADGHSADVELPTGFARWR